MLCTASWRPRQLTPRSLDASLLATISIGRSRMYLATIKWQFKPGSRERVLNLLRDEVVPAARHVAGLRHMYTAAVQGDYYISVLLYDSETCAEEGFAVLAPAVRKIVGDLIGVERLAGDLIIDDHFE
jgi:hypothetical protein